MRGTRYSGEFVGVDGTVWRVEIQQRDYTGTVGELIFPADEPVTISWEEKGKEEPVQGSIATLSIESPGDRTYIDLYTLEAGYITMRVYRNGTLYWSGCLDPEFYEEPYERADKYDVTLTFTDFGILDRIKWETRDFVSLHDIVTAVLDRACIDTRSARYQLPSTTSLDGVPLSLSDLTVSGTNFFDEENEPSTFQEVLEAVLQPLALRIIQRCGQVFVYDINYLATHGTNGRIEWSGDSSTLSADRVVNSCKVTFSPYDNNTVFDGDFDADDVVDDGTEPVEYGVEGPWADEYVPGFLLHYGNEVASEPPYEIVAPSRLVRIESVYSGNDEAMVLVARRGKTRDDYWTASADKFHSAYPYKKFGEPTAADVAIRTRPAYIRPDKDKEKNQGALNLKITVKALVDVRFNPYESAGYENEEGNWSRLQDWSNFGYIPASLYLKDAQGNILYHYDNRDRLFQINAVVGLVTPPLDTHPRGWVRGAPERPDAFILAWYNSGDRASASGFGGWQTNRHSIGYYRGKLPTLYTKRGEGEFIDLPPVPGHLELHIFDRVWQLDYGYAEKDIYAKLRWVAFKEPKIEVVDKWGRDLEKEDIEYTGWINRNATEELSIGTTVGTMNEYSPTARGVLLRTTDLSQIGKLARAGVTDCAERLLIATVYSQYARRHTVLSGECFIMADIGIPVVTEDNQRRGEVFMLAGETQDLIAGTSDCTWVEALEDNWQGLEIE